MMKAKDIDYQDVNSRAIHLKGKFPELKVEITGSWIWVSGNTKPRKEKLKVQGLKWSAKKSKWYLKGAPCGRYGRKGAEWSYIVNKYGVEEA